MEGIRILVENGADLNSRGYKGFTSLNHAVTKGCVEIIEYLLEKGANANIGDIDNVTPLQYVGLKGKAKIAEILLKYGAEIESKNNRTLKKIECNTALDAYYSQQAQAELKYMNDMNIIFRKWS